MTSTGERNVPREQWGQFFAEISRAYEGTPATLELLPEAAGADRVASGAPLRGIDCSRADGALQIVVGEHRQLVAAPAEVRLRPAAAGSGQVVEISVHGGPDVRLHLGRDAGREAMRGSMGGGAVAPAMTTLGEGDDGPDEALAARARGQSGPGDRAADASEARGGGPELDYDRTPATADRDDPAPVGGSAGAAGGSVAAPPGARDSGPFGDPAADLVTYRAGDKMGGASSPTDRSTSMVDPGGSVGDVDLSGRTTYDISADVRGDNPTSVDDATGGPNTEGPLDDAAENDVIDLGRGRGVIDTTVDPTSGGPLVPGDDADDGYVEGEVGAQAERDLDDMMGRRPQRPLPPDEEE